MPRRSILSAAERDSLLALPDTKDELIRHYAFSDTDLSIIRQRRGPANRLGFAVQLCYLRFPGITLGVDELPSPPLLKLVADHLAGSLHVSRGKLEMNIEGVIPDLNTTLLCYCNANNRGALSANTLRQMGYVNARYIAGGLKAYRALG